MFSRLARFFGFGSNALSDSSGVQIVQPSGTLVEGVHPVTVDVALQVSAIWRCVEILSKTISTLPIMVYKNSNGMRELDRDSSLWNLMHESPNSRMTPCEFWTTLLLNLLLRGNAYARIDRDKSGQAFSLWPMPADQVEPEVLKDGSVIYHYRINNDLAVFSEENVLHIKEMGNGTVGLARLDFMKHTTGEIANSQSSASKLFSSSGKPTGVLMIDQVIDKTRREALQKSFAEMTSGSNSRLFVLEANMKYQQLSLTPEDMQLLETRSFGVEEIGRWFGVPSVLINHSNVTTWGSGIEQIMEGFHKLTVRPALVNIEQAIRKRVLTPKQRVNNTVEFNFDGLLRANIKDRMEVYSKAVQNGIKTRNECRQLENDPPIDGGDELTAQTNLVPLNMLGKVTGGNANATQDTINQ